MQRPSLRPGHSCNLSLPREWPWLVPRERAAVRGAEPAGARRRRHSPGPLPTRVRAATCWKSGLWPGRRPGSGGPRSLPASFPLPPHCVPGVRLLPFLSLLRVSGISPVQCKLHTDLLTSSFASLSARSDSQCIRIMGVEVTVGHMQELKMQILRPCPDLVNDTIQVGSGSLYFF